jgi:hypothetical protein
MAVSLYPQPAAGGVEPRYQKFTSSGTFTLPAGYGPSKPLLVTVTVIGGGGGGGGWTNATANWGNYTIRQDRSGWFGGILDVNFTTGTDIAGRPGGSGGIAGSQLYLTENLTVTVGAAGTGGGKTQPVSNFTGSFIDNNPSSQTATASWANNFGGNAAWDSARTTFIANANGSGGSGGISSAASIFASGGSPGTAVINLNARNNDWVNERPSTPGNSTYGFSRGIGNGGLPAGTAGDATPSLGTLAGGSSNTTSFFGSTGIGGKRGDNTTTTGVEGTGGGAGSIGASGAVILTWWE